MSIKILLNTTSNSTIILKIYEFGIDGPIIKTKYEGELYEELMKEVCGIKDIFSIIIDIIEKKNEKQKMIR